MRATDVIYAKRFGRELTEEQIRTFIAGYVDESIPDYQTSALLMAVAIAFMDDLYKQLAIFLNNKGEGGRRIGGMGVQSQRGQAA